MTVLPATGVVYFSSGDERMFFDWLRAIPSVVDVGGVGRTLEITVADPVPDDSLRELIALSTRYRVDRTPLARLCSPDNEGWLKDTRKHWYSDMFGEVT